MICSRRPWLPLRHEPALLWTSLDERASSVLSTMEAEAARYDGLSRNLAQGRARSHPPASNLTNLVQFEGLVGPEGCMQGPLLTKTLSHIHTHTQRPLNQEQGGYAPLMPTLIPDPPALPVAFAFASSCSSSTSDRRSCRLEWTGPASLIHRLYIFLRCVSAGRLFSTTEDLHSFGMRCPKQGG